MAAKIQIPLQPPSSNQRKCKCDVGMCACNCVKADTIIANYVFKDKRYNVFKKGEKTEFLHVRRVYTGIKNANQMTTILIQEEK